MTDENLIHQIETALSDLKAGDSTALDRLFLRNFRIPQRSILPFAELRATAAAASGPRRSLTA